MSENGAYNKKGPISWAKEAVMHPVSGTKKTGVMLSLGLKDLWAQDGEWGGEGVKGEEMTRKKAKGVNGTA